MMRVRAGPWQGSTRRRIVVPDNLRKEAIVPHIYGPTLNRLFRDVLGHYAVVALPCRIKRSRS